jgi:hypothetical protein
MANADEQWAPRIAAHGGDDAYLHRPDREVDISVDQEALREYAREYDIQFMYLDQVLDNLGRETNAYGQKDVRQDLRNARIIAREEERKREGRRAPSVRLWSSRALRVRWLSSHPTRGDSGASEQHRKSPRLVGRKCGGSGVAGLRQEAVFA